MRTSDTQVEQSDHHKARVQRTGLGVVLMLAGAAVLVWAPTLAAELGIPLLTTGAWIIEPALVKRWVLRK